MFDYHVHSTFSVDCAIPMEQSCEAAVAAGVTIYVELPVEMRDQEIKRLEKEILRIDGEKSRLDGKLSNESFTAKAPSAVIEKERAKLTSLANEIGQLEEKLNALKK